MAHHKGFIEKRRRVPRGLKEHPRTRAELEKSLAKVRAK